jgi:hypothetical protein
VWCGSTNRRAVVAEAGAIVRERGFVSDLPFATDAYYELTTAPRTHGCVTVATIGDTGNGLVFSPGSITAYANQSSSGRLVQVLTHNLAFFGGGPLQRPFHLVLLCGGVGNRYAMINGGDGTKLTGDANGFARLGVGSYRITYLGSIAACATTAVATGTGPTSATAGPVWVTPTAGDPSSVDVHTTNLDGTAADQTFSAITSC